MGKTIVCITECEMILNYLFIKEMYQTGDKILLISQRRLSHIIPHFKTLLPHLPIDSIILSNDGDEDLWDTICRTIRNSLPKKDENYIVNLSSGTRLMSIAVQQVFERFDAQFYFMPIDRNVIINSHIDDENDNNDDIVCPIQHQVSIDEYFAINGISFQKGKIEQSPEYTKDIYTIFTTDNISGQEYELLDFLRNNRYRNSKKPIDIDTIPNLRRFLLHINFPLTDKTEETIDKYEIRYLTGGWFEEHIYHLIKESINPYDIATGVTFRREGIDRTISNELDVIFTYNNRLFAIECKTGISKESLYKDIVYKACALKEALLGIRSNAYIFSLKRDTDKFQNIARNLEIRFCGRNYTDNTENINKLFLDPKETEIFRNN
ncbi:MAG: DUF1887 family CARF protein [Bacteroidales bacterium]